MSYGLCIASVMLALGILGQAPLPAEDQTTAPPRKKPAAQKKTKPTTDGKKTTDSGDQKSTQKTKPAGAPPACCVTIAVPCQTAQCQTQGKSKDAEPKTVTALKVFHLPFGAQNAASIVTELTDDTDFKLVADGDSRIIIFCKTTSCNQRVATIEGVIRQLAQPRNAGASAVDLPFFCLAGTLHGPRPRRIIPWFGPASCGVQRRVQGSNAADIAALLEKDPSFTVKAEGATRVLIACKKECTQLDFARVRAGIRASARPSPAYIEDIEVPEGRAAGIATKVTGLKLAGITADAIGSAKVRLKSDTPVSESDVRAITQQYLFGGQVPPAFRMFYQSPGVVLPAMAPPPSGGSGGTQGASGTPAGATTSGAAATNATPPAAGSSTSTAGAAPGAFTIKSDTSTSVTPPAQPAAGDAADPSASGAAAKSAAPTTTTTSTTSTTVTPPPPTPAPAPTPAAPPPIGKDMAPVNDNVVFTDTSNEALVWQRVRLLTLLDLPRPEVLMNVWSYQASSPDGNEVLQRSEKVRDLVSAHNDGLENSIQYGWAYLSRKMKDASLHRVFPRQTPERDAKRREPSAEGLPPRTRPVQDLPEDAAGEFFDYDFYDYITQKFVADPEGRLDTKHREEWGFCPVGKYCLGFTQAFQPVRPNLTSILMGAMASRQPLRTILTTIGCMEAKYEVYGYECFPERQELSSDIRGPEPANASGVGQKKKRGPTDPANQQLRTCRECMAELGELWVVVMKIADIVTVEKCPPCANADKAAGDLKYKKCPKCAIDLGVLEKRKDKVSNDMKEGAVDSEKKEGECKGSTLCTETETLHDEIKIFSDGAAVSVKCEFKETMESVDTGIKGLSTVLDGEIKQLQEHLEQEKTPDTDATPPTVGHPENQHANDRESQPAKECPDCAAHLARLKVVAEYFAVVKDEKCPLCGDRLKALDYQMEQLSEEMTNAVQIKWCTPCTLSEALRVEIDTLSQNVALAVQAQTRVNEVTALNARIESLVTDLEARAKDAPYQKAADNARTCLRQQRSKLMEEKRFKNRISCETLDAVALEAQELCGMVQTFPLSCFTIQAAQSFASPTSFSTFTLEGLNKLAEEPIANLRVVQEADNHSGGREGYGTTHIGLLRAAVADFLFNYKMSQEFPQEFDPYNLQHSAQELNAELNPLVVAFNQDVAAYSRHLSDKLDMGPGGIWRNHNAFLSDGIITVRGIGGIQSTVDTTTQNFFDATQAQSLSAILNTFAGQGGTASGSTASPTASVLSALQAGTLNPTTAIAALAAIVPPATKAQIGRQMSFYVTPHTLPGASSAELDVQLTVGDSADPTLYQAGNATGAIDTLSRVAIHNVTTRVRVESVKLFELSSFSALVQRPRAKFPLVPPFVELPLIGSLVSIPLPGAKEYHRSTAIVSAVIVPTAADLAYGIDFAHDRLITREERKEWGREYEMRSVISFSAFSEFPRRPIRAFHKAMVSCFATDTGLTASGGVRPEAIPPACHDLDFRNVPPEF